jgi:hypothetical protein
MGVQRYVGPAVSTEARTVRVREVGGSSPLAPTTSQRGVGLAGAPFCLLAAFCRRVPLLSPKRVQPHHHKGGTAVEQIEHV